jgi:hypothetical protein
VASNPTTASAAASLSKAGTGTIAATGKVTWTTKPADGFYYILLTSDDISFQKLPYEIYITDGVGFLYYSDFFVKLSGAASTPPIAVTTVADLSSALAAKPANSAETPYAVSLSGVNLGTLSADTDPLGLLYNALHGKYVDLDLSGCTGTAIGDTDYATVDARPDNDKVISLILPNTLLDIGNFVFYNWGNNGGSIKALQLPSNLKRIGNSAFNFISVPSLRLPDSLETLGNEAFFYSGITSISIPATTRLGNNPFRACNSLTSIEVRGSGTLSLVGGKMLVQDGNTLVSYPVGTKAELINNPAITVIGTLALAHRMSNMTSIDIQSPVTDIKMGAFASCNLSTVKLPASLQRIEWNVFDAGQYLTTLVINATTPPQYNSSIYIGTGGKEFTIYVPDASVAAYKAASGWSAYSGKIKPLSELP